jgi:hypothetical protein
LYYAGVISDNILDFFQAHLIDLRSLLQILKDQFGNMMHQAITTVWPFIEPMVNRLLQALRNSPDVVVLVFALIILVVILQILSWVRSVMMFLTRLAVRIFFWASLVVLASIIYQRGFETTTRDMVVVVNELARFIGTARDTFLREYQRYESQQKSAGDAIYRRP